MINLKKKFSDFVLTDLYDPLILNTLDESFLVFLKESDNQLYHRLINYRKESKQFSALEVSELIIEAAKIIDEYLTEFFDIKNPVAKLESSIIDQKPIFQFKKWFVLRRAKRRLNRDEALPEFSELHEWLLAQISGSDDLELSIGQFAADLLAQETPNEETIERLTQWCIQAIKTQEGQKLTRHWASFKLPKPRDYQKLIPIVPVHEHQEIKPDELRHRDGFKLTDPRMNQREVLSEIDYCVYCHDHDGDFCSKGFPEKKGDPSQGFRKNPLDNLLTGCPLDEKISEMHILKRDGYSLGALATIMIDNPMCPVTGHRICNDCMKACIYQKQDPVNIPEIETRVLSDVLHLPWGVEIYDLLTRWNPLRPKQFVAKSYNGLKIFIAGLGPAGFTLAHHLLMEGFAVVGTDGLKLEPLPKSLLAQPIEDYKTIEESLDERIMSGFGGVAEYGITVRWDKNFLKLIYLTLSRRPYFQAFGGVRFGGTVTIESLWDLGFDHAVIAVGAGLPKALPVENSMAKGMRQANDFLMALQLTGAAKKDHLAHLQLRMPIVVIGGGLTGVDTATEAQAYYIFQVEQYLNRYEDIIKTQSEEAFFNLFEHSERSIINEFLEHGRLVRAERERAKHANEQPNFSSLIRAWGGVSIVYRKAMNQSPAYISNHEELHKALQEGIWYCENLQPTKAVLDEYGYIKALECVSTIADDNEKSVSINARSVLVATGAQLNVAYSFEHYGELKRNGLEYQPYEYREGALEITQKPEHIKSSDFGPFTSYHKDNRFVSFVGDTHPVFHGNVVRAIASAMRTYPKILELFGDEVSQLTDAQEYELFAESIHDQFNTYIVSKSMPSENCIELEIYAPCIVKQFKPGQFFKLQNYECFAETKQGVVMQTEPIAVLGYDADLEKNTIKCLVEIKGTSSAMCRYLKSNEPVVLMGPTGVRTKIPEDQQNIAIMINNFSGLAYAKAVIPSLIQKNNTVLLVMFLSENDRLWVDEFKQLGATVICIDPENTISQLAEEYKKALSKLHRLTLIGDTAFIKQFQLFRHNDPECFNKEIKVFASVHSTMQCMLKGVCAQCLQWQVDPDTGKRTKAVFACSWQDQPVDLIDLGNLDDRLAQNSVAEKTALAWCDAKHILE